MSEATKVGILRRAREIISEPARWTQGWFGKSAAGLDVSSITFKDAVSFCALGACRRAYLDIEGDYAGLAQNFDDVRAYAGACDALRNCLPGDREFIARYNDDPKTTHADIVGLFDCAIGKQEAA